jgi:hypothetical protein
VLAVRYSLEIRLGILVVVIFFPGKQNHPHAVVIISIVISAHHATPRNIYLRVRDVFNNFLRKEKYVAREARNY